MGRQKYKIKVKKKALYASTSSSSPPITAPQPSVSRTIIDDELLTIDTASNNVGNTESDQCNTITHLTQHGSTVKQSVTSTVTSTEQLPSSSSYDNQITKTTTMVVHSDVLPESDEVGGVVPEDKVPGVVLEDEVLGVFHSVPKLLSSQPTVLTNDNVEFVAVHSPTTAKIKKKPKNHVRKHLLHLRPK
jgi:hypothetical protein